MAVHFRLLRNAAMNEGSRYKQSIIGKPKRSRAVFPSCAIELNIMMVHPPRVVALKDLLLNDTKTNYIILLHISLFRNRRKFHFSG